MSKMSELHAEVTACIEQGMSAKFLVATFGISYDTALQMIEERENLELEKQFEMMEHARQLEDFSPFETYNS